MMTSPIVVQLDHSLSVLRRAAEASPQGFAEPQDLYAVFTRLAQTQAHAATVTRFARMFYFREHAAGRIALAETAESFDLARIGSDLAALADLTTDVANQLDALAYQVSHLVDPGA